MRGAVAPEKPGRSQFAEAMADHLFGNENRQKFMAVMDSERMAHKFGGYHGGSGPGLNDLFIARAAHNLNLLQQFFVYVRPFFSGASHKFPLLTERDGLLGAVL